MVVVEGVNLNLNKFPFRVIQIHLLTVRVLFRGLEISTGKSSDEYKFPVECRPQRPAERSMNLFAVALAGLVWLLSRFCAAQHCGNVSTEARLQ